jgi:HEAT repeat protein
VEAILAGPDSTTEPAVVAYGELADPRATEKLIDVLVTEVTLKRKALDALAAIDDERTLELAVPVVRESSYTMEVKKDIVETLISTLTGQTIAVEEPLEELLAGEEGEEESG